MKTVRLGIAGLGVIGTAHARAILERRVPRARLAAVADPDPARLAAFPEATGFATLEALLRAQVVDAVIIATPQSDHLRTGLAALRAGVHVLIEKPVAVQKEECVRLLAAHRNRGQVFAAMLNQRTDPKYLRLRRMIDSGALGKIRRVQWTATDWFRPRIYYARAGWRATWDGAGGGVLLNQCPHHLDLFQWLFGMPQRVHGFCRLGRYHRIEVEDDVTAYFEWKDGTHATFIASTGEAPGTNRLEVVAERGKVVIEGQRFTFARNAVPTAIFSARTREPFSAPPCREHVRSFRDAGPQHLGILRNFAAAILDRQPLIASAAEGARSVELANAILLSSWTGRPVDLPMSARTYARWLEGRRRQHRL